MVRVFGTSMIDAAIAPGDVAVIRKQHGERNDVITYRKRDEGLPGLESAGAAALAEGLNQTQGSSS